jgi:hypothetical protein
MVNKIPRNGLLKKKYQIIVNQNQTKPNQTKPNLTKPKPNLNQT